jgi:hypothetical protein
MAKKSVIYLHAILKHPYERIYKVILLSYQKGKASEILVLFIN